MRYFKRIEFQIVVYTIQNGANNSRIIFPQYANVCFGSMLYMCLSMRVHNQLNKTYSLPNENEYETENE